MEDTQEQNLLIAPYDGKTAINLFNEINWCSMKVNFNGTEHDMYMPVNDEIKAMSQAKINEIKAAEQAKIDAHRHTGWAIAGAFLLGAAACLLAVPTCGASLAAMGPVAAILGGCAAGTYIASESACDEDEKNGKARDDSAFYDVLTQGACIGGMTAAVIYMTWEFAPGVTTIAQMEVSGLGSTALYSSIPELVTVGAGGLTFSNLLYGVDGASAVGSGHSDLCAGLQDTFGEEAGVNLYELGMLGNAAAASCWFEVGMQGAMMNKMMAENEKNTSVQFDNWDDMKKNYKGTVTNFLKNNKPLGSPVPKNWFAKGGSLEIVTNADGTQTWIYTSAAGESVPYINNYVTFPKEYLYPDDDIAEFDIGKFTGDRTADKNAALDYLRSEGYDAIPDGYILHHDIESGKMQLVRQDVHEQFTHYGGHYYNKDK